MKYNSIGEQLIAKAKELDPSYKPDKFNDMSEALNIILNNNGSGGSGFNIFDSLWVFSEENVNFETMTLTEVGLTSLNNMYTNGKLLGITDGEPSPTANYMSVMPLCNFTDNTYYFSTILWKDNSLQFIQFTINKNTGAIVLTQKIITATDA